MSIEYHSPCSIQTTHELVTAVIDRDAPIQPGPGPQWQNVGKAGNGIVFWPGTGPGWNSMIFSGPEPGFRHKK